MMIMFFQIVLTAITAFVLTDILTEQGMILNRLYLFICKRFPAWLQKPLISCTYCVAGQWSLWLFIYLYWSEYDLLTHIGFIGATIFVTHIIITLNYKLNNGTNEN